MDVRTAIREFVETPLQLELLVAMAGSPERWWDTEDVLDMGLLSAPDARQQLEQLCARNLLDVRIANSVKYRFAPGNPRASEAMRILLAEFRQNPARVMALMTQEARTRRMTNFADAFRLKKDRGRG